MGLLDGKVALISGAAHGQGRSHAIRLAGEGAKVIGFDICETVSDLVTYPMGTKEELDRTRELVEQAGGQILTAVADVRDFETVKRAVEIGLSEFDHIDIVCANAGIISYHFSWEIPEEAFDAVMGVNVKGVWNTVRAALPAMMSSGRGGSIILTSSSSGIRGLPMMGHYNASKHAVVGLMKTFANELGRFNIRCNTVHPGALAGEGELISAMGNLDETPFQMFESYPSQAPGGMVLRDTTSDDEWATLPSVCPEDISDAILWLASDLSRHVTGVQLPIDAGQVNHQ